MDLKTQHLKIPSPFRAWVSQIWYENYEERNLYHEKPYSIKEYWDNYKWWLRQQYKNLK